MKTCFPLFPRRSFVAGIMCLLLAEPSYAQNEWSVEYDLVTTDLQASILEHCASYDTYRLRLVHDGVEKYQSLVCSTYNYGAELVIDARGVVFVLQQINEGRGPKARTQYLDVSVWNGESLAPLTRTPLFYPASLLTDWTYDYKVTTPKRGGIKILLEGRIEDGVTEDSPKDLVAREPKLEVPRMVL